MSEENVEIVRHVLETFNGEDIEPMIAFAHADLEVEITPEVSTEPDTYRGHDGMRRYFESFREAMDEIQFEAERLWDAGQSVVVAMRLTARGRQTAILVEQRSAGVWEICDGKVIRIRAYASTADALAAVGLAEQARPQENVEQLDQ
jgi:ketosteroid isomerase-like protein